MFINNNILTRDASSSGLKIFHVDLKMKPFMILTLCAATICLASAKPALRASDQELCDPGSSNYGSCKIAHREFCRRVPGICRNDTIRFAWLQQQQGQKLRSYAQESANQMRRVDDSSDETDESVKSSEVPSGNHGSESQTSKPTEVFNPHRRSHHDPDELFYPESKEPRLENPYVPGIPREESHEHTDVPRVYTDPTADPNFVPTPLPWDLYDGMAYSFESGQDNKIPGVVPIGLPEKPLTPHDIQHNIKTLFE